MRRTVFASLSVLCSGLASLWAANAWACGGLFCSSATTVPAPVDQNAERIVFEVEEDTITAHIEIQFVGTARDFAWVVPIGSLATETGGTSEPAPGDATPLWEEPPAVPQGDWRNGPTLARADDLGELRRIFTERGPIGPLLDVEDSTPELFTWLEQATTLQFNLPAGEACADGSFVPGGGGGGGFGCAMSESAEYAASDGGGWAYDNGPQQAGPVTVYGSGQTDSYEFHVVGAERTADLVSWLQDNDYNVSDNMTPVMNVYNAPGAIFLALKLRRDVAVSRISPIALTYRGQQPSIPIRLTAVAAQPLMGIRVFIMGETPYVSANYETFRPDRQAILFDAQGRLSYFDWVARAVDEAGHAFVTEFVGEYYQDELGNRSFLAQWQRDLCATDPLWEECQIERAGFVSRFYTRLSPHQMTLDPVFVAAPGAPAYDATVDLTSRPAPMRCGEVIADRQPSACAFNYCGAGAECAVDGDQVGCICGAGEVAQTFNGPDGQRRVTCVPLESPYGVTPDAMGVGGPFDPCEGYECGAGLCVLRGGFPSCACEAGMVGVLQDDGRTRCVAVRAGLEIYGPGAGPESGTIETVDTSTRRSGGGIEWAIVLVLVAYGSRLGRRQAV